LVSVLLETIQNFYMLVSITPKVFSLKFSHGQKISGRVLTSKRFRNRQYT